MTPPPRRVEIYDTTLRDGTQGEGFNLSLHDKLNVVRRLDDLGIDLIEGGFPLSNPKDAAFFREVRSIDLKHAQIAAFGMTRRRDATAENDAGVRALLDAQTPVVTVVGKSSAYQAQKVLGVTPDDNRRMIADTVAELVKRDRRVIYDAEHFFDAFAADAEYALATLRAARDAGAQTVCLCDTNGGSMPERVADATRAARQAVDGPIGIHTHDDSGVAIANALAAVLAGATQVQGTVNGVGERCGNMDVLALVANLRLKYGIDCLTPDAPRHLTDLSRYVYALANLPPRPGQPYVGPSAFAHKGGMHVHAVQKDANTYEHVSPDAVGNTRRVLVSELSGASNIAAKAGEKFDLSHDKATLRAVLERVQNLEHQGYTFESAEGSFELLVRRQIGRYTPSFELDHYRVVSLRSGDGGPVGNGSVAEASVKVRVRGVGERPDDERPVVEHTVAEGDGPVNALDAALRKALTRHLPHLADVHLIDYKVRVIDAGAETAARVRVTIGCRRRRPDGTDDYFGTVGVNTNIIDASWQALVDAYDYHLLHVAEGA